MLKIWISNHILLYSSDKNPELIKNLLGLNISFSLIFISATINGVTYGDSVETIISSATNLIGIVVRCVVGGVFLIAFISFGYFGLKKIKQIRFFRVSLEFY